MICKRCSQEKSHEARGMCYTCYNTVRSQERRQNNIIDCPKCGKRKPIGSKSLNLCEACYAVVRYHRDTEKQHKRDRTRWASRRERENKLRLARHYANHEQSIAKMTRYRNANREKIRKQQREYYQRNIEHIRERNRNYNKTSRDTAKEMARLRSWVDKQPREKIREIWRRQVNQRQARVRGLPHTLTVEEWKQIKKAHKNKCFYCDKRFRNLTQDHVIPVKRGGGYTAENIVPACRSCNSKKGAKSSEEFIAMIKRSSV